MTRVLTTQLIVFEGVHIEERGSEHEEDRHCLRSYSAKGQLLSADHLLRGKYLVLLRADAAWRRRSRAWLAREGALLRGREEHTKLSVCDGVIHVGTHVANGVHASLQTKLLIGSEAKDSAACRARDTALPHGVSDVDELASQRVRGADLERHVLPHIHEERHIIVRNHRRHHTARVGNDSV